MPKAAIFDVDGTLLDSVDLHALAWQEAMVKFGHDVGFEQVRGQIGKGGDKLIPHFLSEDEQRDHGKEMEEWRGNRFKSEYLQLVRPFTAVPDLLRRAKDAGVRIGVASSAKKNELEKYLVIAGIGDLVDVTTSSDVEESKPAPDIFEAVLKKLGVEGADAVAIGDTPFDAEGAGKAKIAKVNVDNEQDLAIKFDISSIPALLVFKDGKVAKRFVGVTAKGELAAALDGAAAS